MLCLGRRDGMRAQPRLLRWPARGHAAAARILSAHRKRPPRCRFDMPSPVQLSNVQILSKKVSPRAFVPQPEGAKKVRAARCAALCCAAHAYIVVA